MTNWIDYLPTLLQGVEITLIITGAGLLLGLAIALILTWVLESRVPVLAQLTEGYLLLLTGTPLLVQIFLVYYGPAQFDWVKNSWAWTYLREPMFCAILALGMNAGAYTCRLFKGALEAVPKGETLACQALGMNGWQTLSVKLRHAGRRVIPAYSNEVVLVLKGSSLASTISIMEIMGLAQRLNGQTYDTLVVFGLAGAIYLILNGLLTFLFRLLERRALVFQTQG
ncbi:arginine ABC transporter permease ArtM [Oceanisphaera arctica]|uniref:Arginine ABC transporter permease protein ArtM n=1 Tax=Oceanisphaera arctica TaxID=641510 RepID=A0A2P5TJJ6_9GAMM|nr:arginine ABC transporter permease ArtM [Oceanisphaera arctica]PPL15182.1 arginine transporter permease subunit ArtM [Oceanisphaera arctica]GHA04044.1 arginine transporter permease subunit ArtM [Oceanisphaera arctica]